MTHNTPDNAHLSASLCIRKAYLTDLPTALRILEGARAYFKRSGIDQWQDGYPDEAALQQDAANGHWYVAERVFPVVGDALAVCNSGSACDERTMYDERTACGAQATCSKRAACDAQATCSERTMCDAQAACSKRAAHSAQAARDDRAASGDHRVVATFMAALAADPNYAVIKHGAWLTPADAPYGVLHRIAVDEACKGGGVSAAIVAHLAHSIAAKGGISLRCDTHADNASMQRMLVKNGFVRCGAIHLENGAPRDAFERLLAR